MPSEVVATLNLCNDIAAALGDRLITALNNTADAIAADAQQSVGTPYPPASEPGEAPHLRTGELQQSIHAVHDVSPTEADVVSDSDHSAAMEFGTARVAPRPFMTPAAQRGEQTLQQQADNLMNGLGAP